MNLILIFFLQLPTGAPSASEAIDYLHSNVQPVVEFATQWGAAAAMSLTSTQAFLVVCKRFLE